MSFSLSLFSTSLILDTKFPLFNLLKISPLILNTKSMRLTFLGAAREVTGSNILLETAGYKVLLDCGLFQGYKLAEERNFLPFAFNPKSIDLVVIGHAHLDHTGRLPKLVKEGFAGRILSTAPTKDLTRLVLEDNVKLMTEEAKREKKAPLYSTDDVDRVLSLFETVAYDQELVIAKNIKLTLKNAGHILGSAVVVIKSLNKSLVYTSDLGNVPSELLEPPEAITFADYVICETTYGGRIHEKISRRHEKLNTVINRTIAKGGVLMIPTFAIERTQELLHDIEHFCDINNCMIPTFFLDSPLAEKVTKVFEKYPEFLNRNLPAVHAGESVFELERVKITSTADESREIESFPNPKIIIAGSGMLNGGRILYHLQNYISDPKNTLLIVGYQTKETLGRKLLDGESEIKIFGKKYQVRAKVLAIGSYSAHADSSQLFSWLSKISELKKVFLVHGEIGQSLAFSKMVEEQMKIETFIPKQGERFEL